MSKARVHSKLVAEVLLALGQEPDLFIRRNETGVARFAEKYVRFGAVGSPDIEAHIKPLGTYIGMEVKTGAGKLTKQQIRWRAKVSEIGGYYFLVRSVEDAKLALDYVREDLHEKIERAYRLWV